MINSYDILDKVFKSLHCFKRQIWVWPVRLLKPPKCVYIRMF